MADDNREGKCPDCGGKLLEKEDSRRWAIINGKITRVPSYECGRLPANIKTDVYPRGNFPPPAACKDRQIAALTEVLNDKRRLTREIDIIINGENAAQQAVLCDLIPQIQQLVKKLEAWRGVELVSFSPETLRRLKELGEIE